MADAPFKIILFALLLTAAIALGGGMLKAVNHANKEQTNQIQQYHPGATATPLVKPGSGSS
jgi:hypothetical protein